MNYCILNGKKSTLIKGLMIQSLPPISKPLMRTSVEEIDGRDGDIVTKLGYSAYDKQMSIGLFGDYDIDEVIKYFDSEGIVVFSNEPDKYYKYQIIAQIDYQRLLRFKTAVVTFHVQPFKYSAVDDDILFSTNKLVTKPYSISHAGIDISLENNTLHIEGTSTMNTEIYIPIVPMTLSAGWYGLTYIADAYAVFCQIRLSATDGSFFGGFASYTPNLIATWIDQISEEKTYNNICISIPKNQTLNFNVYLEMNDRQMNSISIYNRGNVVSKPVMTINGSGNITLYINNKNFEIALGDNEQITLDGAEMNAYQGEQLMNRYVVGNYNNLKLEVGSNIMRWDGNITRIQIKDASRWI